MPSAASEPGVSEYRPIAKTVVVTVRCKIAARINKRIGVNQACALLESVRKIVLTFISEFDSVFGTEHSSADHFNSSMSRAKTRDC